jgi:hypothetical protein
MIIVQSKIPKWRPVPPAVSGGTKVVRRGLLQTEKCTLFKRELAGVDVRIWLIVGLFYRDMSILNFLRTSVG